MRSQAATVLLISFCFSGLWVLTTKAVFAEKIPTLGQIAHANAESWAAIETVDMEFVIITENHIDGETFQTTSLQNRWIFSPDKERLIRIYDLGDSSSLLSDSLLDENSLREHQVTSDENGVLLSGTISPTVNPIWQSKVNLAPYLLRYPCGELDMDTTKTLGWIIEHWPTALGDSRLHEKDTIWCLHVQCPEEMPWCGGKMSIEVNAAKGFLVQKVTIQGFESEGFADEEEGDERTTIEMQIADFVCTENGEHYFPSGFVSRQFVEPVDESQKPQRVYSEIPTSLFVNRVLPDCCFDFKFEKHEIVAEYDSLSEITAVYLWGDDNRPMETFASFEELDRWQFRQDITAFATDYYNLPKILGKDMGYLAHDAIGFAYHRLAAERNRQQEQLRELAPLSIENTTKNLPKTIISPELLTDETPILVPQTRESAITTEVLSQDIVD